MRFSIGRRPAGVVPADAPRGPDWAQADAEFIDAALAHALRKPSGGWFVIDGVERLARAAPGKPGGPLKVDIAGRELVVWKDAEGWRAAPDSCPHLGASLADGRVSEGRLVCPWHGLKLDQRGFREWQCHPVFDDGVLLWVRLGDGDADATGPGDLTERPILAPRPSAFVSGVIRVEGRCAPEDIIANRLDPWHGAHFHPYSFGALKVLVKDLDVLRLRVTYRIAGPIGIEVDATFHCPEPRTIVMTIVDGDGQGSVVETHATPLGPGRTAMIEATLATSDRPGFALARRFGRALGPLIERAARRLWVDDIAYAERRYALRQG
ncbi:MAG: DUF5914 domain-containing protein [Myxococcota bacterium]